jgi:tripartite ATP-independent transporter DctM subunit
VVEKIEAVICYGSLALLALLPVLEALLRLFLHTGLPSSASFITHLLLVTGLFCMMRTTTDKNHLSISVTQYIRDPQLKKSISAVSSFLSAVIVTLLAWSSISFIKIGLSPPAMIGFIPDQVFALALPAAYFVMAVRFAAQIQSRKTTVFHCFIFIAPLLLGTLLSLPMLLKIIYEFDMPEAAYTILDTFYYAAQSAQKPVFFLLLIAAFAGTPLFVVIGAMALIFIQGAGGEIDVTINQVYTGLTQDSIVPIPLFTLTGFFLSESRAGERLMNLFRRLFGALPGGMIFAVVVICAFFTSFTGATGVTILALGGILYTALTEAGYPRAFSIGLLTASGSIGLLFPPSLPIILVGSTTQTNILHLFLGGIVPGIVLVAAMIAAGIVISIRAKIPRTRFDLRGAASSVRIALPEIILPVFLIAGYFSGLMSLVEIGAFAALYAAFVEIVITRDIALRDLPRVFAKAVPIIGGILAILALSQALSYYIVDTQVPERFARWMLGAINSKLLFLLILNAALLLVGCLVDIFSAILIVLPLVMPLGIAYGIDPVHLGIIFLVNLEAGFLTPPVGLNLFLSSYRFKKPFVEICRDVIPFLLIQLAAVILVTYIPSLSLALIKLAG